jgi:hypothetical protein
MEPDEEALKQTADGYHCCGSIDGKHIRIISPDNSGSLCFNHKDSILSSCSRWLIITTNSWQLMSVLMVKRLMLRYLPSHLLGKNLSNTVKFPPPVPLPGTVFPDVMLGDETFKLTTTFMRPYPHEQAKADTEEDYLQLSALSC